MWEEGAGPWSADRTSRQRFILEPERRVVRPNCSRKRGLENEGRGDRAKPNRAFW